MTKRPNPMPKTPPPGFAIPETEGRTPMKNFLTRPVEVQMWFLVLVLLSWALNLIVDISRDGWDTLLYAALGGFGAAVLIAWERHREHAKD